VLFRCGQDGAHQLRNDTDEPVRVLMVSTQAAIEIAVYPDSDKIGVMARGIGGGDPVRMLEQGPPSVGYYDGEEWSDPKSATQSQTSSWRGRAS
jgi:uncharacterized cupin superfamily protein